MSKTAENDDEKCRLDKWLWAARFFKTRPLARAAIEHGKISYDGQPTIPSKEIELGATITISNGRANKAIIIRGLSTRRRNLDEAVELYEEVMGGYTEIGGSMDIHHGAHEQKPLRYLRRGMGLKGEISK